MEATDADGGMNDPADVLKRLRDAAAECAKYSGPVLSPMSTVDAAHDMEVMRRALGDDRLNYLGFSYGTRLGAVYAARFPERSAGWSSTGWTLTEPLTEQGLAGAKGSRPRWRTSSTGASRTSPARSARTPATPASRSSAWSPRSTPTPVPSAFGEPFTGQDMVGAIGQALYSRELWPSLERALAQLLDGGDTRGLEGFSSGGVTFPVRAPGRAPVSEAGPCAGARGQGRGLTDEEDVPMDNLPAPLMAINCADDPDRPPPPRSPRPSAGCAHATRRPRRSSAGTGSPRCSCVTAAPRARTTSGTT